MSTPNWIDLITLSIVLLSILRGTRYGVLAGILDLAALAASFFAASAIFVRVGASLHETLYLPPSWAGFVAFVVVWLFFYLPLGVLIRWFHGPKTHPASEILGGVVGGIRGLALMTVFLVVMSAAPFHEEVDQDVKRSPVASYLLAGYNRVVTALLPILPVEVPRIGPGGAMF